jgi:hypothetical protein
MSAISIGCEQGGPEACLIPDLKVSLYRLLSKHVSSTHCAAIDEYALVLRVDGSLAKYGEEGLARLRFAKAGRYITLDIQIPEAAWKPLDKAGTKLYLAKQVQAAVGACVERLARDKYEVNHPRLSAELNAAVSEYLA